MAEEVSRSNTSYLNSQMDTIIAENDKGLNGLSIQSPNYESTTCIPSREPTLVSQYLKAAQTIFQKLNTEANNIKTVGEEFETMDCYLDYNNINLGWEVTSSKMDDVEVKEYTEKDISEIFNTTIPQVPSSYNNNPVTGTDNFYSGTQTPSTNTPVGTNSPTTTTTTTPTNLIENKETPEEKKEPTKQEDKKPDTKTEEQTKLIEDNTTINKEDTKTEEKKDEIITSPDNKTNTQTNEPTKLINNKETSEVQKVNNKTNTNTSLNKSSVPTYYNTKPNVNNEQKIENINTLDNNEIENIVETDLDPSIIEDPIIDSYEENFIEPETPQDQIVDVAENINIEEAPAPKKVNKAAVVAGVVGVVGAAAGAGYYAYKKSQEDEDYKDYDYDGGEY